MRATVEACDACSEKDDLFGHDFSANLEVVGIVWGTGGRRKMLWLVSFGNRRDVFSVLGAPHASDQVLDDISRLVAADVHVP